MPRVNEEADGADLDEIDSWTNKCRNLQPGIVRTVRRRKFWYPQENEKENGHSAKHQGDNEHKWRGGRRGGTMTSA